MSGILATIFRHWQPVLAFNAAILAIASLNVLSLEDTWMATAKLILPNNTTELNANLGTLGDLSGGEGLVFSQQLDSRKIISSIMLSNDSVQRVWEADPERVDYPRLTTYKDLFSATPDDTSTIISVSAEGSTPEIAEVRLAAFIKAFQARLTELRQDEIAQRSQFFDKELAAAEAQLELAQRNLVEFQQSSNLVDSDAQAQQLVAAMRELSTSQGDLEAQAKASQARVQVLSARLGQTPEQAIRTLRLSENPGYLAVEQKLSEVNVALVEAQSLFTDDHPQVQYLLDQWNELLRQKASYVDQAAANVPGINTTTGETSSDLIQALILAESDTQALRQQAAQLQTQLAQLNEQMQRFPAAQARLLELQRQYNVAEGAYTGLVAQLTADKVDAFSTYPSVQVLDQPIVDGKPIGPGAKPIALGALLTCVFGSAAIIFFLEKRNPLLINRDIQEVEIPVLGSVPRFKRASMTEGNREFETSVEFQRLASAISMMHLENQRLLITSATASEGKTTITIGLAIALSALGFRVLVVDGDFRKTTLSHQLGYSSSSHENSDSTPIAVRPGLDLLPLTPQVNKEAEFIVRGGFEQALNLAQTTGEYDYILIDTAPVGFNSEAALMAATVSNVLCVVWPGTSNRNPFNSAIEQLTRHKAQILGLIINGVVAKSEAYAYELTKNQANL